MECPFCQTENRLERETCYHCGKDISMLRLIANKARHHYNLALEHAERHRYHQAITELLNALDLDNSLVEARIVLGTMHARLNRPEEARAEWERALATAKPYEKAHIYLLRLRQTRPYWRVLRRLRLLLTAFLLTGLLCALLAARLLWPDPVARQLDRAWRAYETDRLAEAKASLDRLRRPLRDDSQEFSARSLANALEHEFRETVADIERLRHRELPYQALERAQTYLERTPHDYARETVEQLRAEVRTQLAESIRTRVEQASDSPTRRRQAETALARYLETFPEAPERTGLIESVIQAERAVFAMQLDDIRRAHAETGDFATARLSLAKLRADLEAPSPLPGIEIRPPALRTAVEEEFQRMADLEYRAHVAAARTALADDEATERAEAALARAAEFADGDPQREVELAALGKEIGTRATARLVDRFETAAVAAKWEEALGLGEQLAALPLDPPKQLEIERRLDGVRRARATEAYQWLMREADRIENAELSEAEFREVARRARLVLGDLPRDLYPAALDDALFFLAAAQMALGEHDAARATLDQLRRERPRSRHLVRLDDTEANEPTP